MTDPVKTSTGTEVWGAKTEVTLTEAQGVRLEAMEAFQEDVEKGAVKPGDLHPYVMGYLTGVTAEARRTVGLMQSNRAR